MKIRWLIPTAGAALFLFATPAVRAGVTETLVVEIKDAALPDRDSLKCSPDGRHVAYRLFLSNDDIREAEQEIKEMLRKRTGANPSGNLPRDLARALGGGVSRIVCDGKPQKPYADIRWYTLTFSPDGSRLAYSVSDGRKQWVVLDGADQEPRFDFINDLQFSADGSVFSYVGHNRPPEKDSSQVLVDGEEVAHGKWDGIPHGKGEGKGMWFSPDGRRFACSVYDSRPEIVVNEVTYSSDTDLETFSFSPDGQRFGYIVKNSRTMQSRLSLGGNPLRFDGYAATFRFSPDSRHFLFVGRGLGYECVFMDGHPQEKWDCILPHRAPVLHFDSATQFHYLAQRGNRIYCVTVNLD